VEDRPPPVRAGGEPDRRRKGQRESRYAAFISYSRAVDGKLAPALQHALHRFAKPWFRLRAVRVFRDDASLSANLGLWPSIQGALDRSDFFILLASPEAARSKWVTKEIDYWLTKRRPENVLIALTDGEAFWDPAARDFDWDRTTVLGPSMRGRFDDEPRYVDLRWARNEENLSLTDGRFRNAVADLAAPLHGRPKDDLVGEDVRQHRRTVRTVRVVIATLSVLVLVAAGAAVVAIRQRQETQRQLAVATSRQLAATAELTARSDPQLAALLSVAGFDVSDTPEARTSMARQLVLLKDVDRFLSGHDGAVSDVAFSPDGKTLATSDDKQVMLWDIANGTRVATVATRGQPVFSPDGRTLAVADQDGVVLWDVALRRQTAVLSGGKSPIAFSADGRTLTSAGGDPGEKVIVWDVRSHEQTSTVAVGEGDSFGTGLSTDGRLAIPYSTSASVWEVARNRKLITFDPKGYMFSVAFSPDGRTLAMGEQLGGIYLWDLATGAEAGVLKGHTSAVLSLSFSPDGRSLLSGGHDKNVILWDLARRSVIKRLPSPGLVDSVAFGPDGTTFASGDEAGTVTLWRVDARPTLAAGTVPTTTRPTPDSQGPGPIAITGNGRTYAYAGDQEIIVRSFVNPTDATVLQGHADHLAFSPDGRTLAAGNFSGNTLTLWDVEAGTHRTLQDGGELVAFSPDGRLLASAGKFTDIGLWDARAYTKIGSLPLTEEIDSLAISPDGRTLAAGGFTDVTLWDLDSRSVAARVPSRSQRDRVYNIAFSPDGRTLAWTAEGGFNQIVSRGGKVILLDLDRRTELASLPGDTGYMHGVSFSPDGSMVASASATEVLLWSIPQLALISALSSRTGDINSVAFSPDGAILISAGDTGATVWNVNVAAWRDQLCSIANRGMTRTEWDAYVPAYTYKQACP
jgi:WD40 repeat protein